MHTHKYARTHAQTHTHMHRHAHIRIHILKLAHIRTHIHIYTHTHTHMHTHTHTHTQTHMHTHTQTCTYTHTHTQTYTFTNRHVHLKKVLITETSRAVWTEIIYDYPIPASTPCNFKTNTIRHAQAHALKHVHTLSKHTIMCRHTQTRMNARAAKRTAGGERVRLRCHSAQ